MPQHKSCAKRMKTAEKSRQRNRRIKTVIRGTLGEYKDETEKSADKFKAVASVLDRAASKNVIHKNKAARLKSRLAKQANQAK